MTTPPEQHDAAPVPPDGASGIPGERLTGRDASLLLLGCIPLFIALGQLQCWGSEGRTLGIALSMRTKGAWLTPDLYGEFWGFRPLLYFWCVAVSSFFTGGVSELAGRLPAALSGAATVLLTGHLAARLLGRRAAVPAGWVLVTAYSWWLWSRTAAMDTMNVAFATAAIAVYVESIRGFRPWHAFAFAALIGLGSQAKGIPAIILPCAVGFCDALLHRRRDILRSWPWLAAAVPLAGALFAMSFLMSFSQRHDWSLFKVWYVENIQRIYDPYDHKNNPVLYYFYSLPALFMPWGLAIPGAAAFAARTWKSDRGRRFAATAAAVVFLMFTASASRRSYYILPVFPWCALLVAAMFDEVARKRESGGREKGGWRILGEGPALLVYVFAPLAGLALCIAPFLPGNLGKAASALPLAPLGGVLLLAAAGGFWWSRRASPPAAHVLISLGVLLPVYVFASTSGDVLRDRLYVERRFGQAVRKRHPGERLLYYHAQNARLFWYLGEASDADDGEMLRGMLMKQGGRGVVVADARYRKEIEESPLFDATVEVESEKPDIPYRKEKDAYVLYDVQVK
ncbi:MAG: glycosyltransferase family 39 protein [Planctomycetota bacterium]